MLIGYGWQFVAQKAVFKLFQRLMVSLRSHIGLPALHDQKKSQQKLFFKLRRLIFALIVDIEQLSEDIEVFGQNIQFQFIAKFKENGFPDVAIAENSDPPLRFLALLRVEDAYLLQPVFKERVEIGVSFGQFSEYSEQLIEGLELAGVAE